MRLRRVLFACFVLLVAGLAGSAWLSARMWQRDDRPPIIVRGGSIYFDGGIEGDAEKCCNNWKKDSVGKQWKPKPDDKKGVRTFEVTVEGVPAAVCSVSGVPSPEVFIDYREGSETRTFRLYIKAKSEWWALFLPVGKHEPKIDSPVTLKNEELSSSNPPTKPGRLEYGADHAGYISRLKVGATECQFNDTHKATLVITVQPKADE